MSDYIDKTIARRAVLEPCGKCWAESKKTPVCDGCKLYGVAQAIDQIPAADVREVVRGKWIGELVDNSILAPFKTKAWKCDQCGYEYVDPYRYQPHNFCPNCGANMREEQI